LDDLAFALLGGLWLDQVGVVVLQLLQVVGEGELFTSLPGDNLDADHLAKISQERGLEGRGLQALQSHLTFGQFKVAESLLGIFADHGVKLGRRHLEHTRWGDSVQACGEDGCLEQVRDREGILGGAG